MKKLAVLLLLTTGAALAAIPPLDAEKLRDWSDAILVGDIESHTSERKTRPNGAVDTHYVIRLRVVTVEKATPGSDLGKTVTVRGWNVYSVPAGMTGPSGNHTIDYRRSLQDVLRDTKDSTVRARFYLTLRDGKYNILAPNGLEIVRTVRRQS